jgi:tetratricopeptide (TPR) repeat protein
MQDAEWSRPVLLAASTIRIRFLMRELERALSDLDRLSAEGMAATDADEITPLRVLGLAALGRWQDAEELVGSFNCDRAATWLGIMTDLSRLAARQQGTDPAMVWQLLLAAAERADRLPLTKQEQTDTDLRRGEALAELGRLAEAQALFRSLAEQQPGNGEIQERFAELLSDGRAEGSTWHEAVSQWRRVVANSQPASRRWFRAKLGLAQVHLRMGNAQQAADMVRLLSTLHPDLGGPELKEQFEALLAKAEANQ